MDKNLFKNKKVLIMGLGLNGGGIGVAKFFYKQGAEVLVTDIKTKEQLGDSLRKLKKLSKIKYSLGGHKESDFLAADLIIKNPDVPGTSPYLEIARKNNIPIDTDINLFLKLSGAFVIGVTGTKGKSTTSSLIFHILKTKNRRVFLAGNIGISPLEIMSKIKKGDKVVLELSSFALDDLSQSPNIAVVTNILHDHLNRYGTIEKYIESKKIIFKFQDQTDKLVLNEDDLIVKSFAKNSKSQVYFYSAQNRKPEIEFNNSRLDGRHNLSNVLAAVTVARLVGIDEKIIVKAVNSFKGVHSRQEFVKQIRGVKYFNDTTATIPEAVISALDTFSEKFLDSKIFLICGGVYKGVDYEKMAQKIKEKEVTVILMPGDASDKIKESLAGYKKINEISTMQEAVKKASKMAQKNDVVVLSPAASSFNMFKNEFDRGSQFVKAVKNLK